jgi:hypothetical protein
MAGINCVDAPVGNAVPLIVQGLAFQNPHLPSFSAINSAIPKLKLDPISLACMDNLQTVLGNFQDYTNFISGVLPVFPSAILSSPLIAAGLPSGADSIASLSFVGMLGSLTGGLNTQRAMCQADPSNPCALVSGVFSAVLGPGAAVMSAILVGVSDITTIQNTVCGWVEQMIANLANLIASSIQAILNALAIAANYALGKLLQSLAASPCFAEFIGAVATPALQQTLNL